MMEEEEEGNDNGSGDGCDVDNFEDVLLEEVDRFIVDLMLGQFIAYLMLGQIWKTSLDLFHLRSLHAYRLRRKGDKNKNPHAMIFY